MKQIHDRSQYLFLLIAASLALTATAPAQTASAGAAAAEPAQSSTQEKTQPRKSVRRPTPPTQAKVTVIARQPQVAPQVVTIVHRLTGVKMLRYLLRQNGDVEKIFAIDPESISNDAHASIIAGWALDDGKTIAALLPQAGAEIEFGQFPISPFEPGKFPGIATTSPLIQPRIDPDLTVITNDGRRLRARYVGLDGETGLSVLQVSGTAITPITPEEKARASAQTEVLQANQKPATATDAKQKAVQLAEGQKVQVFAPERTEGEVESRVIFVKVVETEAKVSNVARSKTGELQTLSVRIDKLSPVLLGGVACDESGNTLGIVDAFEGKDARIVPTTSIRAATHRVLEKQASVPKPLLGVRGEPVDLAARSSFLAYGWHEEQLKDVMQDQLGILLTLVMPGTPAAVAKLRPGDVILSVNREEVKSAEEFSKLLSDAGSGAQVQFAVRRPGAATPMPVDVKLGGSFDPTFEWHSVTAKLQTSTVALTELGIETAILSSESVNQLGAQNGLLVVAVHPESAAARSGIREGDMIESIDGHLTRRGTITFALNRQKKHVFSIIRKREKKQVVVEADQ